MGNFGLESYKKKCCQSLKPTMNDLIQIFGVKYGLDNGVEVLSNGLLITSSTLLDRTMYVSMALHEHWGSYHVTNFCLHLFDNDFCEELTQGRTFFSVDNRLRTARNVSPDTINSVLEGMCKTALGLKMSEHFKLEYM